MKSAFLHKLSITILMMALVIKGEAQTTEFTYQGSLADDGVPANGNYDFEFRLFDQELAGTQIGGIIASNALEVADGSFAVVLDFGDQFPGDSRWLEIRLRQTVTEGTPDSFTVLSPRQRIRSAPYSIRSANTASADTAANALQLGGVAPSGYVLTSDIRLSDARAPTPGSGDYVQNSTTEQAATDFNISGTGEAGILSARTQFNKGSDRVMFFDSSNTIAGISSGKSNDGISNAFFGAGSGFSNVNGDGNSFFGNNAGSSNVSGGGNSFFGKSAGFANISGDLNTYIGQFAGVAAIGGSNAFFGGAAGQDFVSGYANTLIGSLTGYSTTSGTNLTALGSDAGFSANGLTYATAIGSGAKVGTSNTIMLGRESGDDTVYIPGDLTVVGTLNADITIPSDSPAYIHNSTASQTGGNFNITGEGIANIFNAQSYFALTGTRVLSIAGTSNVYLGQQAGSNDTDPGTGIGANRTMVGKDAGHYNTGSLNSFFGATAGAGSQSLVSDGTLNAFFGFGAGLNNQRGDDNSFFGANAGTTNTSGNNNTLLGASANVGAANLNYATAIGSDSVVSTSNTIMLGRANGSDGVVAPGGMTLGSTVTKYSDDLNINDPNGNASIYLSGDNQTQGINIAVDSTTGGDATMFFSQYDGVTFKDRLVINANGNIEVRSLGSAGSTALCRNASNEIATCSSSIRYKRAVRDFSGGLDLLARLRPVLFEWIDSGLPDMGLVAEEVAAVEPSLATYNASGDVEGVKYDRIGVLLVNVVKAQQGTIEKQGEKLKQQSQELDTVKSQLLALKAVVCADQPGSVVCRP